MTFGFSGEKAAFTVDDYFKVKDLSDVQVSPDGRLIAFVKREIIPDKEKKGAMRRKSDIYMVKLPENAVLRLTSHEKDSSNPRWSPDGHYLAFLSARTEKTQIWLLDMKSGGEATQLTDWKQSVDEFSWSPDGKSIAFLSKEPEQDGNDTDLDKKPKKDDPYVITRTKYLFDGIGYFGDPREYHHIWRVSISDPKNPKKITDGNFDDGGITWSPDGTHIAFVSNRTGDDDNNDNTDIWIVPSEGGEIRQLTTNPGADGGIAWWSGNSLAWSPDGKRIAYVACTEPNNLYKLKRLWVIPAEGGTPRCISKNLDREVTGIIWSRDSRSLYGLVPDKARVHVYRFSSDGSRIEKLLGEESRIDSLAVSKDEKFFAFLNEDNNHSAEIFTASLDGKSLTQRTFVNTEWLNQIRLGKTEKIQFKNPDGQTVEGFELTPPDFDPGKKYPLILKIHGGPQGTDGNYFNAEGQWYASNGYVVLWVNYRGSSDYGEAWQEAITKDWYSKEYDDLMAAVDFMCDKGYVDTKKMGVTGVSYGGIMTNWIVGHTDRFAAAAAERSTVDNFSSFGVDDCAYWYEKDFGLPYEEKNFELYRNTSPILYIKNVTTSLLIMQCMEDHRCPLPQAFQFYMGLKKLKRAEVQMVLYPREFHGIREIPHQRDRLERIVSWFNKHMKDAS